ncbi:MAG: hypothetical protein IPM20_10630 [Gammaproteobacteria bacterium]|nr:hypothetical protein [Gammaproteobacteria bacterium]
MSVKELLSVVAVVLTLAAFLPYIRSILKHESKPHVFSWVIWGSTTFIVFLAQREGGGGVGAWPIGISGVITLLIALLAWSRKSDISISRLDWLFFTLALWALPLWYATADPLWAVAILTLVDVLGFGPTVRKVYHFPWSESLVFFGLFAARNLIVILALENYSLTTVLFPAVIGAACVLLIALALHRRRVLAA